MKMTQETKDELARYKIEQHDKYLASRRRRYRKYAENPEFMEKQRERSRDRYASLNKEQYKKCLDRANRYYKAHKDDPDFIRKKREQNKEYRLRNPKLQRKRKIARNIKNNPGYTTSRGVKITFRPSGLEYRYYATKGNYFFESEEYHDFQIMRKAALKEYGV